MFLSIPTQLAIRIHTNSMRNGNMGRVLAQGWLVGWLVGWFTHPPSGMGVMSAGTDKLYEVLIAVSGIDLHGFMQLPLLEPC